MHYASVYHYLVGGAILFFVILVKSKEPMSKPTVEQANELIKKWVMRASNS
jgi:hypothetical protein